MQENSCFSTPSPASIVCRFFDDGHSDQGRLAPHCRFDLPFSCMDVRVGLWRKLSAEDLMLLNWRRLLRAPWTARRSTQSILKEISPGCVHWKCWRWSWNSNTLATWYEGPTHLKRPWCWERLRAGGEGDDRGWDGWTVSPIQWTWV